MAQLGLDPEAMQTLSRSMTAEADKVDNAAKTLDGRIRGVWWKGKDADQFKGDWEGHKRTLTQVADALRAAAKKIDQNVTQQTQASGS